MAEKIIIERSKKRKKKEEEIFGELFSKKMQKKTAYPEKEDESEENTGTFEISEIRTFEISADNEKNLIWRESF